MRVWVVFALLLAACDEPASARSLDPAVVAARGDDPAALLASLRADPGELGDDEVAFEDASGHALDVFHRALRRADAGEGTARIAMYGGSHTAGDHYTGRIREVLQARFGDAGHGFVPLVPVVRNHWAWGAVIDEAEGFEVLQVGFKRREVFRYGLAGAAFQADEPEAFAAVTGDSWGNGRQATRVDLLYDRVPGGGTLEVWLDGAHVDSLSTAADPARNGLRSYEVSDATHRLEVRAVGDGPVTVFGVVMERDVPGVVVHNLGLVGSKARHQLLWDEDQWAAYLRRLEPDLVVFAYGNNETTDTHLTVADHERDLRAALARVERAAPDASCLLLGPTDRPLVGEDGSLEPRPVVAEITEMQRRVAADLGCAFFDTLAFQGGLGSGATWRSHDPPYLGEDLQHLTRPGYLRWGEAVVRQLMVGYRPPA
ncbi:MAG: hypothetical protein H6719_08110 [Sandaracinaceae bacterium]|nr:hypothetical protein [Sandaracinaceae bacterium]